MRAQHSRIALALGAALICVSPVVGGAGVTPADIAEPARTGQGATTLAESGYTAAQESLRVETPEPAAARPGQSRIEDGRANRNSPHPAVLSYEHPVFPIKVPNPPVSLERY